MAAFQAAQQCLGMEGSPGCGKPPLMTTPQVPAQWATARLRVAWAEGTPPRRQGVCSGHLPAISRKHLEGQIIYAFAKY